MGYMTMVQALNLLGDFKLGHYSRSFSILKITADFSDAVHVNPRHVSILLIPIILHLASFQVFIAQTLGSIIGCFVNYAVLDQVIDAKRPYLDGSLIDPTGQVSSPAFRGEFESQSGLEQWDGRKPFIFMNASVIWGLIAPSRFFSGKYKASWHAAHQSQT